MLNFLVIFKNKSSFFQIEPSCKKANSEAVNLRAQIKDYIEDAARAKLEVDVARREIERLNRELSSLRNKMAE